MPFWLQLQIIVIKFRYFLQFVVLFVCACIGTMQGAPTDGRRTLPALRHEEIHDQFGQYALRYVTAEGTVVSERGRLIPNADGTDHVLIYEGEYTYVGDDGRTYVTKYTSDTEGFQVTGDHLPKAPEASS